MAKRHDVTRDSDWITFAPAQHFRGTPGDDDLVGTAGRDKFHIEQGGTDSVSGGQGNDTIYVGASLTAEDHLDGGTGSDKLVLEGDYSSGLTLQPEVFSRIEILEFQGNFNYAVTFSSDIRHDTNELAIDARQAGSIYFDGSALDLFLVISGSNGDDVIVGGDGVENIFNAGKGRDLLTGGSGQDGFFFSSLEDSLANNPDVITNFDVAKDGISLQSIDANPQKPGDQAFHFGATPHHIGDVTVTYDKGQDITSVNVFTDKDDQPDMVIHLLGNHTDLTAANFVL